jgi:hypothetical protein
MNRTKTCAWLKRPLPKLAAMALSLIPVMALAIGVVSLGQYLAAILDPAYATAILGATIVVACIIGTVAPAAPTKVEILINTCKAENTPV